MELRNYAEMGAVSRRFMLRRAFSLSDREIDQVWAEVEEEMQNPIFQALLAMGAARNGLPSVSGDLGGQAQKGGNDNNPAAATAPDTANPKAVTKNGIPRGTKMGQKLRGNMSS
jgi:hypothetical protein